MLVNLKYYYKSISYIFYHTELLDKKAEQIRSKQIAEAERLFVIRAYCKEYGSITRKQAGELCRISLPSAAKLLSKMQEDGDLEMEGKPPRN